MHVFFRADGNGKSASGHIVRCLTIADALEDKKVRCEFIVSDEQSRKLIVSRGYPVTVLNTSYDKMDDELGKLISVIKERTVKLMFVDSYYVTAHYFDELSRYTKIIYFNDIFEMPFQIDMVITYGSISRRIDYKEIYERSIQKLPYILRGREYVPLREEFQDVNYAVRKDVKNVLVTVGGADRRDFLFDVVESLCKIESFNYHVVVGVYNKSHKKIKDISKKLSNVYIYENCDVMCELMQECDIAISAGGTTIYELCAVGTPTICVCLDNNQKNIVTEMRDNGVMLYAGDIISDKEKTIKNILNDVMVLSGDYKKRCELSAKMKTQVDGGGTQRIVENILEVFK